MTSIRIYDPADSPALPELPLPIGVLAAGAAELLGHAADLPQPRAIFIYHGQAVSLQFAPEQAGVRAVARWAQRFGAVLASQPADTDDGPKTYHRAGFEFCGIEVTAYTLTEAEPASS